MKTLLTLLSCLVLYIIPSKATEFYLVSTNPPPPKPQFTACEGAMALVVLVVGGVVIYKICKANFWTNIPAPPEPPPEPPRTNSPSTNNPATNNPPAGHHWFHWSFGGGNSSKSQPDPIPIYYQTNSWISPDGLAFDTYVHTVLPNPSSSRDLTNWNYCSVDSWGNSNGCLYVLYDGQGLPLYTNYTTESSNVLDGFWATEPQEFFKWQ